MDRIGLSGSRSLSRQHSSSSSALRSSLHVEMRSKAANLSSGISERDMTKQLISQNSVAELSGLVSSWRGEMNAIHVSAAFVRLARLLQDEPPSSLLSPLHRSAEEARVLSGTLESLYMDLCRSQRMQHPRQHSNIAWATGVCQSLLGPSSASSAHFIATLTNQLQSFPLPISLSSSSISSSSLLTVSDNGRRPFSTISYTNASVGLARLKASRGQIVNQGELGLKDLPLNSLHLFGPREISNLCWSWASSLKDQAMHHDDQKQDKAHLATLRHAHPPHLSNELMQAVGERATTLIALFKPQELATLLWSFSKLGLYSQPLFDAASKRWATLLHQARAAKSEEAHLSSSSPQLLSQEEAIKSQDVANFLWAFAKAGHRSSTLLETTSDALLSCLPLELRTSYYHRLPPLKDFKNQELVNVAWSYATLQFRDDRLVEALMDELAARSEVRGGGLQQTLMNPQSLSNSLWAMARLGGLSEPWQLRYGRHHNHPGTSPLASSAVASFTRTILARASIITDDFSPQEISVFIWSLFKLHEHHRSPLVFSHDLNRILEATRRRTLSLAPPALAQLAWVASCLLGSLSKRNQNKRRPQLTIEDPIAMTIVDSASEPSSHGDMDLLQEGELLVEAVCVSSLTQVSSFSLRDLHCLLHPLSSLPRLDREVEEKKEALFSSAAIVVAQRLSPSPSRTSSSSSQSSPHSQGSANNNNNLLSPGGLSLLAWSFARQGGSIRGYSPLLISSLLSASLSRLHLMDCKELANLTWAVTTLHSSQTTASNGRPSVGKKDLRVFLNAVAACWLKPRTGNTLIRGPKSRVNPSRGENENQGRALSASVLAWCFGRCRYSPPLVMDALASCAASTPLVLASIPSYNLAQMIWACAALESSPQVLWRSLSDEGGEQEFKLLLLDLVGDEAARRIKMRTKGSQNLLSISGLQSYNSDTLDDEEKELSQGRKEWRDMIEGADPPHSQEPLHAADVAVIAESYARMGQPHPELFSSIIDDIIHLSDPKDSASSFIPSQRASQGYYGTRELEKLASAFSTLSHPQEEIVIARLQLALSRQARRRREREGEIASMDLDLDEEGEGVEDLSLAGRRRRKREPWHSAAAAAASVLTSFAAAAAAAAHAV